MACRGFFRQIQRRNHQIQRRAALSLNMAVSSLNMAFPLYQIQRFNEAKAIFNEGRPFVDYGVFIAKS